MGSWQSDGDLDNLTEAESLNVGDKNVGAYMLISIYAQGQSKYIFRFSLILFFYHIPFTVRIL